ncbi:hypothetical protein EJB05_00358, partial [Eragrostis curvula]
MSGQRAGRTTVAASGEVCRAYSGGGERCWAGIVGMPARSATVSVGLPQRWRPRPSRCGVDSPAELLDGEKPAAEVGHVALHEEVAVTEGQVLLLQPGCAGLVILLVVVERGRGGQLDHLEVREVVVEAALKLDVLLRLALAGARVLLAGDDVPGIRSLGAEADEAFHEAVPTPAISTNSTRVGDSCRVGSTTGVTGHGDTSEATPPERFGHIRNDVVLRRNGVVTGHGDTSVPSCVARHGNRSATSGRTAPNTRCRPGCSGCSWSAAGRAPSPSLHTCTPQRPAAERHCPRSASLGSSLSPPRPAEVCSTRRAARANLLDCLTRMRGAAFLARETGQKGPAQVKEKKVRACGLSAQTRAGGSAAWRHAAACAPARQGQLRGRERLMKRRAALELFFLLLS